MTTLADLGEFGFIKRFSENFKADLPEGFQGIGDDCAVMPCSEDEVYLVTTDMLVENQHFLPDKISAFELGHKSLAVNLSDIAAMGGKPVAAFLSLGIRSNTEMNWLDNFFKGLKKLTAQTGTLLLGGDTTKVHDGTVVNIAVIGKCKKHQVKKRSGARPGDIFAVTGMLGDSAGGLKAIQQDLQQTPDINYLIKQHHLPAPHLQQGMVLSNLPEVTSMMDISDGLASDIRHITEQSAVGAQLDVDKIPVSDQLKRVCKAQQWDLSEVAIRGGEDYCLLLTVKSDALEKIKVEFEKKAGTSLVAIGKATEKKEIRYVSNGKIIDSVNSGFDHFRNENRKD